MSGHRFKYFKAPAYYSPREKDLLGDELETFTEEEILNAGTFVDVAFPCEDAVYLFTVFTMRDGRKKAHLRLLGPSCEECSLDLEMIAVRSSLAS